MKYSIALALTLFATTAYAQTADTNADGCVSPDEAIAFFPDAVIVNQTENGIQLSDPSKATDLIILFSAGCAIAAQEAPHDG